MSARPAAPDLRGEDARARELARSEFRRPLVLEAGAGTGKTAVLVSRVLAWGLGPGWELATGRVRGTGGAGADPEAVAPSVLERVVALTFTEKAAAEMEERVGQALRACAGLEACKEFDPGCLPLEPALRESRARALLAALDRFQVGTIHAFCRKLLAAHPIDAGRHPSFEVDADGRALESVIDDWMAEEASAELDRGAESDLLALAVREHGPDKVRSALVLLLSHGVPAEAFDDDPCGPERAREAALQLKSALEELGRAGAPILQGKGQLGSAKETLTWCGLLAAGLAAADSVESLLEVLRRDEDACTAAIERLGKWGRDDFTATEDKSAGAARAKIAVWARLVRGRVTALLAVDPEVLRPAGRLFARWLRGIRERSARLGIVTFHDLLEGARRLLDKETAVLAALRSRIDQLLIDEFQDTDPIQYEIVGRIALEGPERSRPGLFLVGDPKQSIYGWRNADLQAYEDFVARLLAAGGERLPLCVNFRSVVEVLDEVARVMRPIMIEEAGIQPPFQPLLCGFQESPGPPVRGTPPAGSATRQRGAGGGDRATDSRGEATVPDDAASPSPVEHWVSWLEEPVEPDDEVHWKTHADRARELEAAAIAADLLEQHASAGLEWKDAAILLRSTPSQEIYLEALREAGIPFVVDHDRSFYRRREVFDAVSLLRTVLDPHDQLALLGLLRSPWVGVPDAALVPLWRARFPELMATLGGPDEASFRRLDAAIDEAVASVPKSVPGLERIAGYDSLLKDAARGIASLREAEVSDDADRFLDRLRGWFQAEVTEAARFRGLYRQANLERLFHDALEWLASPQGGVRALLRELRAALEEGRSEEEARPGDSAADAVRVLTIHKAKGLTFRQVYVAGLHGLGRGTTPLAEAQLAEGRWEFSLFEVPTPGMFAVTQQRERIAAAETIRLLYVATTRPRHRLVLAGSWPDPSRRRRRGTSPARLVDLLGERDGVPELARMLAGKVRFEREAHGVLWRILGGFADRGGLTAEAAPVPRRDLEAAARGLGALRELRAAAVARQSRPLTAAVTADGPEAAEDGRDDEERDASGDSGIPTPDAPAAGSASGFERAIGTAIHRALEHLDLDGDLETAAGAQAGRLEIYLREGLPPAEAAKALPAARELWERVARGSLVRRLADGRDRIVARELPLLLSGDAGPGPAGAWIGSIDLLLRDAGGGLVIVDYKTDRAAMSEADAASKYAAQKRAYVEAVRRAFPAEGAPRFELWFLSADRVVVVP